MNLLVDVPGKLPQPVTRELARSQVRILLNLLTTATGDEADSLQTRLEWWRARLHAENDYTVFAESEMQNPR